MAADDVLTVAEAATELGMTPVGIRYRLERGLMYGRRASDRLWLIPRSEVERVKAADRLRPGRKRR